MNRRFITLEQLKSVVSALLAKINQKPDSSNLSDVSFTGDYNDLNNRPDFSNFVNQTTFNNAASDINSNFMMIGRDYVTAGQVDGTTLGIKATAEGYNTTASGTYSHAEGELTKAVGTDSHAQGKYTYAQGSSSNAEGFGTFALGNYSHAEGKGNTPTYIKITGTANTTTYTSDADMTNFNGSHIILLTTYSSGINSATILSVNGTSFTTDATLSSSNDLNEANAAVSSSGYTLGNYATGQGSHVEGTLTRATHNSAHAEGYSSTASGQYGSHAEGYNTSASGTYGSHAEGRNARASGSGAHAEGYNTTASANYAHAEGYISTANGANAHAEGNRTQATGENSHAEGSGGIASGGYSHAEGIVTAASNNAAHAEGALNIASGIGSHAEGQSVSADGDGSHAEGGNAAIQIYLSGAYNATTFTVESCDITNVFPTIYYDEDFIVGAHVNSSAINNNFYRTITNYTLDTSGPTPKISTIEINSPFSTTKNLATNDTSDYNNNKFALILSNAKGRFSHSEGYRTIAKGQAAHAEGEGTRALSPNSHAEGVETYVSNDEADGGHAEGIQTVVTGGFGAHAEGDMSKAQGDSSHAEGESSVAKGWTAHAEGYETVAFSQGSHSEGNSTIAKGMGAHAEGYGAFGFTIHLTGAANATTYTVNETTIPPQLFSILLNENAFLYSDEHEEAIIGPHITNYTLSGANLATITVDKGYSTALTNQEISIWIANALGHQSHSEGYNTYAVGENSHAQGRETIALDANSYVAGKHNIPSTGFVEIVGNGSSNSNRSNARTLDWSGNETLAGTLTIGGANGWTLSVDSSGNMTMLPASNS